MRCLDQSMALVEECTSGDLSKADECKDTMQRLTDAQNAQAAKYPAVELMSETEFQPQGFDYPAAGIGASVGFVAAYALLRSLKRKNNDDFERV